MRKRSVKIKVDKDWRNSMEQIVTLAQVYAAKIKSNVLKNSLAKASTIKAGAQNSVLKYIICFCVSSFKCKCKMCNTRLSRLSLLH